MQSLKAGRAPRLAVSCNAAPAVALRPQLIPSSSNGSGTGRFVDNRTAFKEEYRIRGYEALPDQTASILTVANLMQDVAGNHGVSTWGRTDKGFAALPGIGQGTDLLLVMTRLQLRMHSYPKWGDVCELETYYNEDGRLAARRDWSIRDALTGVELGCATSTWVTINMATRRLSRVPEDLRRSLMQHAPQPERRVLPLEETKLKLPNMPDPAPLQGPVQVARRSDMDMNGHINNVSYLAWALETVPRGVYDSHVIKQVEIDFKAECHAGDTIEGSADQISDGNEHRPLQFLHSLKRCDANGCTELVRVRTHWVPR